MYNRNYGGFYKNLTILRVYFKCLNCKYENRLKSKARTRVELAMKNGKTKELHCKNCHKKSILKVNKIYAKESKFISILAGSIFLIGTFLGLYFVMQMISEMKTILGIFGIASGLLIPVWIYGILKRGDRIRVKTFNQTHIYE